MRGEGTAAGSKKSAARGKSATIPILREVGDFLRGTAERVSGSVRIGIVGNCLRVAAPLIALWYQAVCQKARPLSLAIWRTSSGESWVESVMIPSGMPRLSSFSVTCFMALYLPSSIATSSARF